MFNYDEYKTSATYRNSLRMVARHGGPNVFAYEYADGETTRIVRHNADGSFTWIR